ncbi:MAG: LysR family transcriptional regulator [Corynebacterium sp.]|uniref:LysR family transcriptional regulator n=1 Tax=unclassified Corynebacterium TaxID=2624378 RepID=UPI002647A9EA|nr:LysR family transcriptional regulator [Corynebacterium sp.]MDN5720664.1 LysR family transcriptional regulator [Corynebacterium sp.]
MRITDITVEQMRATVCVADQGGFTLAADRLGQSQSSLSRTVSQVEKATGARLFDRTTRSFALTDAGTEFLRAARVVLETYDREINNLASYLRGPSGELRLATLPSLAATLLPPFIDRFRRTFPNVGVSLQDLMAANIIEQCRYGTVDLAITAEDPELLDSLPDHFRFSPIAEEHFACILPVTHRLADRDAIDWEDLAGDSFVSFTEASSVRRITDRELAARGIRPSQTVTAGTISAVTGLCAANLGISAVPGFVIPMTRVAGVVLRPFRGEPVTRTIGVLQDTTRTLSPAAREFLTLVAHSTSADMTLPDFTTWTGLGA